MYNLIQLTCTVYSKNTCLHAMENKIPLLYNVKGLQQTPYLAMHHCIVLCLHHKRGTHSRIIIG